MSYTDRDFLNELADLTGRLRREIEAYARGLDPKPESKRRRRARVLGGDFTYFAYTYFPHHIRGEPSLFQAAFCARFPQLVAAPAGCREWWKAPRGEAKSSLLTKIGPCYLAVLAMLQDPAVRSEVGLQHAPPFLDYALLLGAETKLPTKLLEVVKTELEMNPALLLDFPEACGRGRTWRVGDIITRTGVKLEPFGAEQAIRGTFHGASRPKVLFADDLITDAEAKSATEKDNRWTWLEKAIDFLGPPDGSVKFFAVGTELAKGDPMSRASQTLGQTVHHFKAIEQLPERMDLWEQCEDMMRNADRDAEREFAERGATCPVESRPSYQFYLAHQAAMDAGAITSWPSVRTLYWLMFQRAKNRRAFATEMQGISRSEEDKVFSHLSYWVQRDTLWTYYGGVDPSMGKGKASHPSAIVIGGVDRNARTKRVHVVEASIKRRQPSKLMADLIAYQRALKMRAIGFENNNAYEYMRGEFIAASVDAKVPLPLVPIPATAPAEVRIDGLEPFITDAFAPSILFHASLTALLDELDTWPDPQTAHDYDGLDALEIMWRVAVGHSYAIEFTAAAAKGGRHAAGGGSKDFMRPHHDDDNRSGSDRWEG